MGYKGPVPSQIVVEDANPEWRSWFGRIANFVEPHLGQLALRIEHVGSTSVPGLAAKPVIDIDVVVRTDADVARTIESLERIGYRWRGDLGIAGREAFFAPEEPVLPRHHLYLVVQDNRAHSDHWLLRDALIASESARTEYAELKRRNAAAANGDMDYYVDAKAAFVATLLTRARQERNLPPVEYYTPDLRVYRNLEAAVNE